MEQFAELGTFDTKKMNPQNAGLPFILCYLSKAQGKTVYPSDLAKASGVSTARVAAALNKLEEMGMVFRTPSEQDSRKTIVGLTEKGIQILKEKNEEAIRFAADIIDLMGMEDLDEFLRLARRFKDAMKTLEARGSNHV